MRASAADTGARILTWMQMHHTDGPWRARDPGTAPIFERLQPPMTRALWTRGMRWLVAHRLVEARGKTSNAVYVLTPRGVRWKGE
jgi:hypothetical protein